MLAIERAGMALYKNCKKVRQTLVCRMPGSRISPELIECAKQRQTKVRRTSIIFVQSRQEYIIVRETKIS
jgi:hypothetical protein